MKTKFGLRMLVVLLLLVGWVVSSEFGALAQKPLIIYVVVHGEIGNPYWKKVEAGVRDAAALLPENVRVVYTGPEIFSFEGFFTILEAAIAVRPDGLVATMTNPEAMDDLLREVIADGLPVMAIDTADSRPALERIPYLTYIGELSYEGGVLAARETLRQYRPKRAVYGNSAPGHIGLFERGRGFLDVMAEAGVPAEAVDATADPVQGAEVLLAYLLAHPETDTIFTANMLHAETLVTRLEEEGIRVGEDVHVSTFGLTSVTMDMLARGQIDFSIDEQPYMQGFLGVTLMYLHLTDGFTPPPEIPTLGLFPEDIEQLRESIEAGRR